MRRGLGGVASRRSKAALRIIAGDVFVGTTLASMGCVVASLRPPCYAQMCCAEPARAAPAGRAAASARPRVARMSARTNARRLAARLFGRALCALHLRRSALHTTMMARGTEDPRGPVLRAVPAGAAGRTIVVTRAIAQTPSTRPDDRRDRHEVTHRELNGSSMFMSRSILFDTDAMQPRAAKDARGTTSTAQPPLPRCS